MSQRSVGKGLEKELGLKEGKNHQLGTLNM